MSALTTLLGLSLILSSTPNTFFAASAQRQHRSLQKSIVNYGGTDFLLHDGCPEPLCDLSQTECQRTVNMVRNLYSHCLQSEDGQHIGCVTDRIGPKSQITLPVYASICSAMCYEAEPNHLKRVHRCPYPGFRQHNPSLGGLF